MPTIQADNLVNAIANKDIPKIREWYAAHPGKNCQWSYDGRKLDPIALAIYYKFPNLLAVLLEPGHEKINDIFDYNELGMTPQLYSQLLKHESCLPDSLEQLKISDIKKYDKIKFPKNISDLYRFLDFMPGIILKLFLSPKPLPDDFEFKNWIKVILGVMYPLLFERFPDNVGASHDWDTNLVEWQNTFANWLSECGLIPNADKNSLPRSFSDLVPLDKKRQWAVAIYSNPTAELIELMRPLLISKSYKNNLEQQQFLKKAAKQLQTYDGLLPYLTEYSDYYVMDHHPVWFLMRQKTPEDLPRNLNFADREQGIHLFESMRWFISSKDFIKFSDYPLSLLTSDLRKDLALSPTIHYDCFHPPLINQASFEFIFYVIEFLVMTHNPEPTKKSACVELLHACTEEMPILWWILSKLYEGHVIPESTLWPYRNAKSARNCVRISDILDTRYPLLNYFLTRSSKNKIEKSTRNLNTQAKPKSTDTDLARDYFALWFEKQLSCKLEKYGIAETVVPPNYDPYFGLEEYKVAHQNFCAGENTGLFYDPINQSQMTAPLYPALEPLTKEQFLTIAATASFTIQRLTPLIFSSLSNAKTTAMCRALVSSEKFPKEIREQLLTRNSINNIPLHALANLFSLKERYEIFKENLDEYYLQIIDILLQTNPRSYLSSNDDRVLLLNCRNRLTNVAAIIPKLSSYQDFLLFDHSEIWLYLTRHIPLDMQNFVGNAAFESNYLFSLMLAKWWTAKNGEHQYIDLNLSYIELMIPKLQDGNISHLQVKMELLCYVVRTLLNRDEKRKHIHDGCKKILNFYAEHYPALHWLLAKMYEGNLLVGSIFLKNYPASHKQKFNKTLNDYEKLAIYFPILTSIALNKHREPIATSNQHFDFKDMGLKFLAWLELFFLFNLKNFGINQNIVATAYPKLFDPAWRAEFENKFTEELRLGRDDGLFYSLPDANSPAHIQLEPAIATAPPESLAPSTATSTVNSRASSPPLSDSTDNLTQFSPEALENALNKLKDERSANSDYAAVADIEIITGEDFCKVNDDGDMPEETLESAMQSCATSSTTPIAEAVSDPETTLQSETPIDVEAIQDPVMQSSSSSSSVSENIEKTLANMPVENSELFPDVPTAQFENNDEPKKVPVALCDSIPFTPKRLPSVVTLGTPVATKIAPEPAANKSFTFFPPAEPSKPIIIPGLESIANVQEKIILVDKAFAKESANLTALTQVVGHADTINPLSEKIIQTLTALLAIKVQLQKQLSADENEPVATTNLALENRF